MPVTECRYDKPFSSFETISHEYIKGVKQVMAYANLMFIFKTQILRRIRYFYAGGISQAFSVMLGAHEQSIAFWEVAFTERIRMCTALPQFLHMNHRYQPMSFQLGMPFCSFFHPK